MIGTHVICNGPLFSYNLRYIVDFELVEKAISTNPKPTMYLNLYEITDTEYNDDILLISLDSYSKYHEDQEKKGLHFFIGREKV